MILFFGDSSVKVFAVKCKQPLTIPQKEKLSWLFSDQPLLKTEIILGDFYGPRATMVTPWSTNAVEIAQNMGISGIERIEFYEAKNFVKNPDPMLLNAFDSLNQEIFEIDLLPEAVLQIDDIAAYNKQEGLALNDNEVNYLENLANSLDRSLTDSEVFGFSQVNSEHCRHKIFNGQFIINGEKKKSSLFNLIKKTSKINPNTIVSAYKDNVAFIGGPLIEQFAPQKGDLPSSFKKTKTESVISLKAETHNFPTTVEPFNGAATGSGAVSYTHLTLPTKRIV